MFHALFSVVITEADDSRVSMSPDAKVMPKMKRLDKKSVLSYHSGERRRRSKISLWGGGHCKLSIWRGGHGKLSIWSGDMVNYPSGEGDMVNHPSGERDMVNYPSGERDIVNYPSWERGTW